MQIKSIFTRKDFSLSLVLKGRVFRTWEWPISILETSKGLGTNALSFIWLKSESGRYLEGREFDSRWGLEFFSEHF